MQTVTEMITIKTNTGTGTNEEFQAYMAKPEGEDMSSPVIIVIQEIFGINGVMRSICDGLAYQGYIAVCPDLFWRQEAGVDITDQTEEEWAKAIELYQGFSEDKGVEDLITTMNHMREYSDSNGKVGTMGYCLGGKMAYLMAMRSDADCNVGYYGVGIENAIDGVASIKNPLMLHIAENDQFVTAEAQATIIEKMKNYDHIETYHYLGVEHAFARIGGEHYNQEAANKANYRTADFLAKHLTEQE